MNKEEFVKVLTEKNVPKECHDSWWNQWDRYTAMFKFKCSKDSLVIFAAKAVEKGCFKSAPW